MRRQEETAEVQASRSEDEETAKLAKAVVDVLESKDLDRRLSGSIMALGGCAAAAIVDLVIFVHLVFNDGGFWSILLVGLFLVFMCWQVSFYFSRALRARAAKAAHGMRKTSHWRRVPGSRGGGTAGSHDRRGAE